MALNTVSSDRLSTNVKNTNFTAAEKQDLTNDILPLAGELGNRNKLINGKQEVNQRNATVTSSGYVTDRWTFNETTDGAVSVSQVVDAPVGFYNSLKVDVTTADTSLAATQNLHVFQQIEGTNIRHLNWGTANAKTVTVSFYVKTTKTGVYSVVLENNGTDRCQVQDYTVSDTNWNRYSLTFTGDTAGTWLANAGIGIRLRFGLASGSNFLTGTTGSWLADDMLGSTNMVNFMDNTSNDWFLSGCQVEVGSVATDFEHLSFADDLRKCQRYYHQVTKQGSTSDVSNAPIAVGNYDNGSNLQTIIHFPVQMRANPSVVSSDTTNGFYVRREGSADFLDNFSLAFSTKNCARIFNNTDASGTAGTAGNILQETGDSSLAFNAEL